MKLFRFLFIFLALGTSLQAQKAEPTVTIVVPGINTTSVIKLDELLMIESFPASKEGYKITGFTISYTDQGKTSESTSESNKLNEDNLIVLGRIRNAKVDPVKLTFSNIKAVNPKGKPVLLANKTIKVKK
ncbi:MAG: hypothetical protein U0T82_01610 [Bacteroidales bacterium]